MNRLELDAFLTYQSLSAVEWNPAGTRLAFLVHALDAEGNRYKNTLWVYEADSDACRRVSEREDVASFSWLTEDELLLPRVSGDETAFFRLSACTGREEPWFTVPMSASPAGWLDADTLVFTSVRNLVHEKALAGAEGAEKDAIRKRLREAEACCTVFDEYPFWMNGAGVINKTRKGIFLYSVSDKTVTQVTRPDFRCEDLTVDPSGRRIFYTGAAFDTVCTYRSGLYGLDVNSGTERCLAEPGVYCISRLAMLGEKLLFVYYKKNPYDPDQCPDLMTADPETGEIRVLNNRELSLGNPVGSDCRYGSGSWLRTERENTYFISGVEESSHVIRCSGDGALETLTAQEGSVDCFDVHEGRIAMVAMYGMRLQELYLLGQDGQSRQITHFNDSITEALPPVQPEAVRLINSEGVEIHGYILRPKGFDPKKKYPGILDIHGGPRTTYGPVYYHEMQLWANMGYFVFFCNPTGSDGRGNDFGFMGGRYGTVDYDDIMRFTDCVLSVCPQIDSKRLGVVGGSYGGFMVNWVIGHTNCFAAAVAQRSISNMGTMELCTDLGKVSAERQTYATVNSNLIRVWDTSPLKFADRVTTPTLFIHSDEDYRCWMAEALQMYTALRYQGVDTRLCLFHGENHELSRRGKPLSRVRRLQEMTDWLEHYLKA